jgi:hypothetical protein
MTTWVMRSTRPGVMGDIPPGFVMGMPTTGRGARQGTEMRARSAPKSRGFRRLFSCANAQLGWPIAHRSRRAWDCRDMEVRARTEADLDIREQLAKAVRGHDGYPTYLPDDLRAFIAAPHAIATWVADHDGEIIGHVALNPTSSDVVMALVAGVTGRPADHLEWSPGSSFLPV